MKGSSFSLSISLIFPSALVWHSYSISKNEAPCQSLWIQACIFVAPRDTVCSVAATQMMLHRWTKEERAIGKPLMNRFQILHTNRCWCRATHTQTQWGIRKELQKWSTKTSSISVCHNLTYRTEWKQSIGWTDEKRRSTSSNLTQTA